jgi:hypothetical protein
MPTERRDPQTLSSPSTGVGVGVGLMLLLAALLALAPGRAIAANTHGTLVQPASTGHAKTARQSLLKQRTSVIAPSQRHPGKIVGGGRRQPRTIVTRRFLPK